jgi:hypothetical protein
LNDIDAQLAILKGGTGGIPTGASALSTSAFAFPAAPLAAASGGSNRSLAVSFAQGSIVINAVPGDTANSLADMIDKRILHQVSVAAGRL